MKDLAVPPERFILFRWLAIMFRNPIPVAIDESEGINSLVLTGSDLPYLTSLEWDYALKHYAEIVFARTTPEQKV